jgi:transglutaminase-like putative cysteine protease
VGADVTASARARLDRGLELLPVLSALAVNAVAHARWPLAGPVGAGLVLAVWLGWKASHRASWLLLAGAAGALVGLGLFLVEPPPVGPIPPVLLSALCGGLTGVSAFCVVSGNRGYAWVYAWLVAVLSANAPLSPALLACLAPLAVSTALALVVAGRVSSAGPAASTGFVVFALVAAVGTWQLTHLIRASEGLLMETVFRLTSGAGAARLQGQSLDLPSTVSAPVSDEPLFELEGEAPRYLRTQVLEAFDGRRWSVDAKADGARLSLPGGEGSMLELTFLAPNAGVIPVPAGLKVVTGAASQVHAGWLVTGDELAGKAVTLVRGPEELPLEPLALPAAPLPEALREELSPLAEALLAGKLTARAQAEALERHFSQGFEYSLDVDLRGKGHPLAVLVRERRAAFCTYFASAMVALLRTRGVPARLVTGFAPAERNAASGRTLVRARDAHAWVEVYLAEEQRWAAFDPTPFRSRDAALGIQRERGWLGQALATGLSWARRVFAKVRYTPGDALLEVLRSPWAYGSVALAALAVFGRRRRKARGRTSARAALDTADPALRSAYARYLALMKRAGLTRAPNETDDELLARLGAAAGDEASQAATRFVSDFRRARFRAPEGAGFDESLRAFEATLERRHPPPLRH